MHELPYEPPREGAGDSRRLARWLAMGSLAVFSLYGASWIHGFYNTLVYWDGRILEAYSMQYLMGTVTTVASAAVIVVWLVSGRVPSELLAVASASFGLQTVATWIHVLTEYGWHWDLLGYTALSLGGGMLVWLFLTPTFRRAVNAPRTARA